MIGVLIMNAPAGGNISWGRSSLGLDQGGKIELGNSASNGATPYIDFHFGVNSPAPDFNVRLINDADGQLSLNGHLRVHIPIPPGGIPVNGSIDVDADSFGNNANAQ